MKHTYKKIDKDGTVECTKCGLRNSDLSKEDYIKCSPKINIKAMKLIKLTSLSDKKSIYINVDMIGHIYKGEDKQIYGKPNETHTVIGTLTHNNGGFKVIESVEEVFKRIKAEE